MRVPPLLKKILGWGSVAFLVFFVTTRPGEAADILKAGGNVLIDIGNGIGDFFAALVS